MDASDRIEALERQIEALEERVRHLSAPEDDQPSSLPEHAPTSSRRNMLKLAGVAAVGAVAAATLGEATPAAATNGLVTTSSTAFTRLDYTGSGAGNAFFFQSGNSYDNPDTAFPSALAAYADGTPSIPNGVYAYTSVIGGFAVVAAAASHIGLRASGNHGNMLLYPSGTAPTLRATPAAVGTMINDSSGELWLCVAAGTPGTWRKVSGPATAGAFHAITPGRAYDSRRAIPAHGILPANGTRSISVADGRNTASGAVVFADMVPAGATAVVGNVTVTNTGGTGYLVVNPGGVTATNSSTINWTGANVTLANSFTSKLNASRQLTLVCKGHATDVVVDIVGYYL